MELTHTHVIVILVILVTIVQLILMTVAQIPVNMVAIALYVNLLIQMEYVIFLILGWYQWF